MNNDIEQLVEPFRSAVKEMVKRCKGIPEFRVIETIRTKERQVELFHNGYSKTLKSKHLIGEACDIYVRDWSMDLYNQVYERIKDIPYIIWPYKDLGWKWDGPHFEFDRNKKSNEREDKVKEPFTNEIEIEKLRAEKTAIIQDREAYRINKETEIKELREKNNKEIETLRGEITGHKQDNSKLSREVAARDEQVVDLRQSLLRCQRQIIAAEQENRDQAEIIKQLRNAYKVPVITARETGVLARLLEKLKLK